jgi:hypothetical protein
MGTTDDISDLTELVEYLTPREDNEMIKSYQNTTAVACPICEEPFDDLVVCKSDQTQLELSEALDLCVTTDDESRPFLFTHKE